MNIDNKEEACKWFMEFQSSSKTTMPESRKYKITGNRVLFREMRHYIHSSEVKKKQGQHEIKCPQSSRTRNIGCTATVHLRLERQ